MWIKIKDELPPFEKPVFLCVAGDKSQDPIPKRLCVGSLSSIKKNGPIFTHWDEYADGYEDVLGDVIAWHPCPELPEEI